MPAIVSHPGKPVRVRVGDVYVFQVPVSTRAGHTHAQGSSLAVLERTEETPHGEVGPHVCNWVCETVHGSSVWATLESCIQRGLLKRIKRGLQPSVPPAPKPPEPPVPTAWQRLLDS